MASAGLFGLAGLFFGGEFQIPPDTGPPVVTPPVSTPTQRFITVRAVRCSHATPTRAVKVDVVILV